VRRDSTFLLRGQFYEAPPQFAGETIEVRFDPLDPSEVEIYVHEEAQAMAGRVDPVLNAQLPSPRKPLPGPAPVPTGIDFVELLAQKQHPAEAEKEPHQDQETKP
jgi:Mu transposase, C-terminal